MLTRILTAVESTPYSGRYKWHLHQSISAWLSRIRKWRQNATTRKELAKLPSYLYQDIGLTEQQVRQEIHKKFWQ